MKRRIKKNMLIALISFTIVFIALSGTYLGMGFYYVDHFMENTIINGMDVSDKTVEQVEEQIASQVEDYEITLIKKDGKQEKITGEQINYHFVSGGEIRGFLEEQNILLWLSRYLGETKEYTVTAATAYDEALLEQTMKKLNCFDVNQVTKPKDAALVQLENGTWRINGEREGNQLKADRVLEVLKEAIGSGERTVNLAEKDCYEKPSVYSDDAKLNARAEVLNRYAAMKVTYTMGGGVTKVLDSQTINSWMTLDENNQPVFDRQQVQAWVAQLAAEYDTIGTWEPFRTSLGETVYVEARTYGWQLNQEQETEELYQLLLAGESTERWPAYYESAFTRGENDIGDTYVEIDYTNQRMWFYKDAQLMVDTPVVTGSVANHTESPEGIFCLVGKSEDEILKGEDYETPVEYWMPFYGGVGIHDADSWRGNSYGGTIYQYGGSHGCINTPTANAKKIYEMIEVGTPIICYKAGVSTGTPATGSDSGTADIVINDSAEEQIGVVEIPESAASQGTQETEAAWQDEIIVIG